MHKEDYSILSHPNRLVSKRPVGGDYYNLSGYKQCNCRGCRKRSKMRHKNWHVKKEPLHNE